MRNMYEQALMVQDACNSSGVALSLANEIIPAARAEIQSNLNLWSTTDINRHPAVALFIAKLADLAGLDVDFTAYGNAYTECTQRAMQVKLRAELDAAVALAAPVGSVDVLPAVRRIPSLTVGAVLAHKGQ
jgi:hypothetical protein